MAQGPHTRLAEALALAARAAQLASGRGAGQEPASARPLRDRQKRLVSYLRISVTDRCNYRCQYCMPDDIAHAERADVCSFEETTALVACFVALGVSRLRITGGEPTVRKDLPQLVGMLRDLPGIEDIALSTNGHLLPTWAGPLRRAGVDRLNVSLDSLDENRFRQLTGRGELGEVLRGLDEARRWGFASIKTNAVVLRGHNDDELLALVRYAWERDFMPRFIEPMPMADGVLYRAGELVPAQEIRSRLAAAKGAAVVSAVGGTPKGAGPARYFAFDPGDPAQQFGIISPMTEHFCDDCNRVRLGANGRLHACLASDDAVDLRTILHDQGAEGVTAAIEAALAAKRDGHNFQLLGIGGPRKAMVQIGG